ncbi:MAG TPA: ABC transporter ATP-binding protein [Anaerolineales bacterium]|nr:ABC transporter ATP-binding protein [Anaerolineales bacterium]
MIETRDLTRRFGDVLAVDRLTVTIERGEIFGLLGPNGAGKTTTIRMLAALIEPTSGEATVAGCRLGRDDPRLRSKVGFLTETPGLYDRLSAEANLAYFAELYDVEDVPGQVEHYLRWLGLWDRRHEPASSLSKGMRQKLAIARALLHEPSVVFLDEPTSSLDPEASRMVREFIGGLRREGRTIVLCTHNLDEADRLCDRVAVFRQRLLALDAPANLRRQLFGRTVVFHLKDPDPSIGRVVDPFPGVASTQLVDGRLLVTLEDPERDNPSLIRALVDAGAEIQFVGELRQTLEDVYFRLVGGDPNPAGSAEAPKEG